MFKSNKISNCLCYQLLWGRWLGAATLSLTLSYYFEVYRSTHTYSNIKIWSWQHFNLHYLYFSLFFVLLLLSTFWTSCGLRCRPFPGLYVPSVFIAQKVQHCHWSSTFIKCCQLTLSHFPRVNLCTRKSPYDFIRICTRGNSNSRNWPIAGTRITRHVTGATGYMGF